MEIADWQNVAKLVSPVQKPLSPRSGGLGTVVNSALDRNDGDSWTAHSGKGDRCKTFRINNNKSDGLCKCFILAWPIGLIQRAVPQDRQGRSYHRGDGGP